MIRANIRLAPIFLLFFSLNSLGVETAIHKSHGLSHFDQLKYPEDFKHFDYVNPEAPKGGHVRLFANQSFDTLNPYSTKGVSPALAPSFAYMRYGVTELNEPLMVGSGTYSPSGDEIKTAYGLIAESVEYPDDNRWIIFNLRPEARFHDGHQVTADDVIFSYKELKAKGHPRYKMQLEVVDKVEKLNSSKVKFTFKKPGNRIQLFRVAELPVLPAHYWKTRAIDKTTFDPILNSGPYRISHVKPGVSVTYHRVEDYWGKDLPVNKGRYNFDKVTVYFYRSLQSAFESFKAGGHDLHIEIIAKNWFTAYDFPAVKKGDIKQIEIPHQLTIGSPLFHFNTRRQPFDDIKVRQAISLMFDFQWIQKALFYGSYFRSDSYFPNTDLKATGMPSAAELKYLLPWRSKLPEKLFEEPFSSTISMGDGNIRRQKEAALRLLGEAGWVLKDNKLVNRSTGKPLTFSFINVSGSSEGYLLALKRNLRQIGIQMKLDQMDTSQYYRRLLSLDFDMVEFTLPQTHSPDFELYGYFHSNSVNEENTKNLSGIQNPVVDALVEAIPDAKSYDEFQALTRSLDRVLVWQHYGIPKWYSDVIRVAYRDIFDRPERSTEYTPPFSTWWINNPL